MSLFTSANRVMLNRGSWANCGENIILLMYCCVSLREASTASGGVLPLSSECIISFETRITGSAIGSRNGVAQYWSEIGERKSCE